MRELKLKSFEEKEVQSLISCYEKKNTSWGFDQPPLALPNHFWPEDQSKQALRWFKFPTKKAILEIEIQKTTNWLINK